MYLISHRGNIFGIQKNNENEPNYIENALKEGFNVEIDVRFENNWHLASNEHEKYNNLVKLKNIFKD